MVSFCDMMTLILTFFIPHPLVSGTDGIATKFKEWFIVISSFAIVLGIALLAPLATVAATALAGGVGGSLVGTLGRLAARTVARSVSRTGVAIAALAVAVSVTIGVGLMIASFRSTVENWLDLSLRAEYRYFAADYIPTYFDSYYEIQKFAYPFKDDLGRFGGGVAAARWLAGQGAVVTVTDLAEEAALAESVRELSDVPIERFRLGEHREEDVLGADLVVVSTAHPAKFSDAVQRATGSVPELPARAAHVLELPERLYRLDPSLEALEAMLDEVGGSSAS